MRYIKAWPAPRLRIGIGASKKSLSVLSHLRDAATAYPPLEADLSRTRNIGIIAHIDAGKTTTTERMLYYSGCTRRIGDVDEGSTVTDFLPAERARGITIQSAAITFHWPPGTNPGDTTLSTGSESSNRIPKSLVPHNINLIDTPGHADFTFEVVRSLRILDGAVCILDGVAGVEAQTEKVWAQADSYRIPRLVYVNKLDRDGAAFGRTVKEIGVRLQGWPAVCQIPWWKNGKENLTGVVDIVGLRGLLWEDGSDGRHVEIFDSEALKTKEPDLYEEMKKARISLVELLSEHDEIIVEKFFEHDEDHLAIPGTALTEALRRCVLQFPQRIIPVFAGASFRNIGVQPVLDAVIDLLPSPDERPDSDISIGGVTGTLQDLINGKIDLTPVPAEGGKTRNNVANRKEKGTALIQNLQACALAFKVVNDARRGVLVYVRVYSGSINRMASLFNTNLQITEKAPRLLKMYASDAIDVPTISSGQIGVIAGLKYARTGDTLISYTGVNPKVGPPSPINTLQLRPIAVPPPVFFTSVEPNSLSEEKPVADALDLLLREDPSLNVTVDTESGQTHLAGMGELHLEIATDRVIGDFKAKARIGKIEIGYREAVLATSPPCTEILDREVAGKQARASCTATVSNIEVAAFPIDGDSLTQTVMDIDLNQLIIEHPTLTRLGQPLTSEDQPLPQNLPFSVITSALQTGVAAALARGPQHSYPVHSARIKIDFDPTAHIFADTTPASISAVARQAVHAALKRSSSDGGSVLMEPVMLATISVPESDLGSVVHDLNSARGGQVISLDGDVPHDTTTTHSSVASAHADDPYHVDLKKIYAPKDPFGDSTSGNDFMVSRPKQRQIIARVPLKEMVGYLKHLRSLTAGRGTFVMTVDKFEKMSAQRQKVVLNELRGAY